MAESMGNIILTFTCPKCSACFDWEVPDVKYMDAIKKDQLLEAKCYLCGHTLKFSPKQISQNAKAANQSKKKGFFSKLFKK
ncbi:MAG: hypothetical protein IJJ15_05435 [Ruminococcus sp.]|jgi:Zn ribbon nucleic-acid-binding protein|nr:hypothetical protein [Ruminococcus sp.]